MARLEASQLQHASEKGFYVLVNFFLEFSHLMTHPVEMKENTTTAAADAENTTTTDERCSRQVNQIR